MNNKPLISVIVPVYNVEKYLSSCVESILSQTYSNLEIILINDGSNDSSKEISLQFASKDKRIVYFEKENSGLSDTRNVGLEHATGEYIIFVDSDDLLAINAIESLYGLCSKYNAELAVGAICHFMDGEQPSYNLKTFEKLYDKNDAICDFLYQKNISTSACGKIYKSKLLETLRFKSGTTYEDNLFLSDVLDCVEKVPYFDQDCYGYRHRNNSITTKHFSEHNLDILLIGEELLRRYECKGEELREAVHVYQATNCLRIYLTAPEDVAYFNQVQSCKAFFKLYKGEILRNANARLKLKLGLVLSAILPKCVVIKIYGLNRRWG